MRTTNLLASLLTLAATVALEPSSANAVIDIDADRIFLQKDCTGLDNCFETMSAAQSWLWNTRTPSPSATSPVILDIGPGDYGNFYCPSGNGWVTLRGSGRDQTRIVANGLYVFPLSIAGCERMGFQDLTAENDTGHAIVWTQGGSSTWTNVDSFGGLSGWYDFLCDGVDNGTHWTFGSRFWGGRWGWFGECGDAWIYGGDIAALPTSANDPAVGLQIADHADVRLFGGTVRVVTNALPATATISATGVLVGPAINTAPPFGTAESGSGTVHMHGGIISVNASNLNQSDATGLRVDQTGIGDATAHVVDTAYAVIAGQTGTTTRVQGAGAVSPFLWQAGDEPPVASLVSERGFDLFVETDCNSAGACDDDGTIPRLMIYRAECGASNPWYDTGANACRQ